MARTKSHSKSISTECTEEHGGTQITLLLFCFCQRRLENRVTAVQPLCSHQLDRFCCDVFGGDFEFFDQFPGDTESPKRSFAPLENGSGGGGCSRHSCLYKGNALGKRVWKSSNPTHSGVTVIRTMS